MQAVRCSKVKDMLNADKPQRWNDDTRQSVLQYNEWFMEFAPKTYQDFRKSSIDAVERLFEETDYLSLIDVDRLIEAPDSLTILRMMCAPPIARDRLAGLADVSRSKVKAMEEGSLPSRGRENFINKDIPKLLGVIFRLLDTDLLPWTSEGVEKKESDVIIAEAVILDRLCGITSDPIIRNSQEKRQLDLITDYLEAKGYTKHDDASIGAFDMPHGTFAFHKNVRMFKNALDDSEGYVNTPVDVVIMPNDPSIDNPILIECKSAGDFANTNKRRKEEDTKVTQLRGTYGDGIILYLFLCGYFDATYLGYEAANHMDWIWEHRIEDFEGLGI